MNKSYKDKIEELKNIIDENATIKKKDILTELEKAFINIDSFKEILINQAKNKEIFADRIQSTVDTIRYLENVINIYIELIND